VPLRNLDILCKLQGVDLSLAQRLHELIRKHARVSEKPLLSEIDSPDKFDPIFQFVLEEFNEASRMVSSEHSRGVQPSAVRGDVLDLRYVQQLQQQRLQQSQQSRPQSPTAMQPSSQSLAPSLEQQPQRAHTNTPQPKRKDYLPQPRSGGWAILLAFALTLENDSTGRMVGANLELSKDEIVALGSSYSKTSFESSATQFYSAWNDKKTLENQGMLRQRGRNPVLYSLTPTGLRAAYACFVGEFSRQPKGAWAAEFIGECPATSTILPRTSSPPSPSISRSHSLTSAHTSDHSSNNSSSNMRSSSNSADIMRNASAGATDPTVPTLQRLTSNSPTKPQVQPSLQRGISLTAITSNSVSSSQSQVDRILSPSPKSPSTSMSAELLEMENKSVPASAQDAQMRVLMDEFEIIILLDIRERHLANLLQQLQPSITIRSHPLSVGDIQWVAEHKPTGKLYVLDYIIERKTISDLYESVQDARYRDQRARLLKSRIKNVMYMIEGDLNYTGVGSPPSQSNSWADYGRMVTVCQTVIAKLTSVYGFLVLNPHSLPETVRMLTEVHDMVVSAYQNATVAELAPLLKSLRGESVRGAGEALQSFEARMKKRAAMCRWRVFGTQLRQIRGCSSRIAMAILRTYPTPAKLIEAFRKAEELEREPIVGKITKKELEKRQAKYMLTHINTSMDDSNPAYIGKAVSEAIYDFFLGNDPSTVADADAASPATTPRQGSQNSDEMWR